MKSMMLADTNFLLPAFGRVFFWLRLKGIGTVKLSFALVRDGVLYVRSRCDSSYCNLMKRSSPSDVFWLTKVFWSLSWDRLFNHPVLLPKGLSVRTLREAAEYVMQLPIWVRDRIHWRLTIHTFIEAAEDQGPVAFARMAMIWSLEHEEHAINSFG